MELVQPLPPGAVDVIGDVHGELEVLQRLLRRLGYRENGSHPGGRWAVFLGDLVDRGPDSLGVAGLVEDWWRRGRALALLGNHELNLLQERRRSGNEWFFGEEEVDNGRVIAQRLAGPAERARLRSWLLELPLALEREDLLVVHACWEARAVEAVRRRRQNALALLEAERARLLTEAEARGLERDTAERDLFLQNGNPVRVLTSGLEEATPAEFVAGGRIRRTHRVRWWESWAGPGAVVFGHYWRSPAAVRVHAAGPDLFAGHPPLEPLGPARRAFCIDYSVGRSNKARARGQRPQGALGALRWPEGEVVLEPAEPGP